MYAKIPYMATMGLYSYKRLVRPSTLWNLPTFRSQWSLITILAALRNDDERNKWVKRYGKYGCDKRKWIKGGVTMWLWLFSYILYKYQIISYHISYRIIIFTLVVAVKIAFSKNTTITITTTMSLIMIGTVLMCSFANTDSCIMTALSR